MSDKNGSAESTSRGCLSGAGHGCLRRARPAASLGRASSATARKIGDGGSFVSDLDYSPRN
jgi:hypothetical protein